MDQRIFFVLALILAAVSGQSDEGDNEYDDKWYLDELADMGILSSEDTKDQEPVLEGNEYKGEPERNDGNNEEKKFEDAMEPYLINKDENENKNAANDHSDDYLIEDNRFYAKEDRPEEEVFKSPHSGVDVNGKVNGKDVQDIAVDNNFEYDNADNISSDEGIDYEDVVMDDIQHQVNELDDTVDGEKVDTNEENEENIPDVNVDKQYPKLKQIVEVEDNAVDSEKSNTNEKNEEEIPEIADENDDKNVPKPKRIIEIEDDAVDGEKTDTNEENEEDIPAVADENDEKDAKLKEIIEDTNKYFSEDDKKSDLENEEFKENIPSEQEEVQAEDSISFETKTDDKPVEGDAKLNEESKDNISKETPLLLDPKDTNSNEAQLQSEVQEINASDEDQLSSDEFGDDDTVEKVMNDLSADLDKLYDTYLKLQNSESIETNDHQSKESINNDLEKKTSQEVDTSLKEQITNETKGKTTFNIEILGPSDIGEINSDEDKNIDMKNEDIIENIELDKGNLNDELNNDEGGIVLAASNEVEDYEDKNGVPFREKNILSIRDDYYENIEDDNLSEIFKDTDGDENLDKDTLDAKSLVDEDVVVAFVGFEEEVSNKENSTQPPMDATTTQDSPTTPVEKSQEIEPQVAPVKTKRVEELTSSEYDGFMKQFNVLHADELNEDLEQTSTPIHIKLSLDEPVVITSPDFPNAYPTNNVIDWILEGDGEGIEMNVTDFAVNGALGDYVLIKPGQTDASGTGGLILSYRLNSERRYRFTDVDRMFIRFEARPGMVFLTGFSLSVKMIRPKVDDVEDIPEPEPIVIPETPLFTVTLGGLTASELNSSREDFRLILADMATMYINANNIDPGKNTTSETTEITAVSLCRVNWPDFERCSEVTFRIPLVYENGSERLDELDLQAMWYTYVYADPFATRLRRLGVMEFMIPNDNSVMTMWLVAGAGVLLSMAALAFALWRSSCFEDYTRMSAYSDTDSLQSKKRGLDLYPTPHQTLPPLYTESEYTWSEDKLDSTRVDMGGLANRSYARDDMYDLDSDEDVVSSRNRYTTDV